MEMTMVTMIGTIKVHTTQVKNLMAMVIKDHLGTQGGEMEGHQVEATTHPTMVTKGSLIINLTYPIEDT
jgi:hypothetical protein